MLYVFGDSLSSGFGFIEKGETTKEAKQKSWPNLLAIKINETLVDHSFPGASNWTIARKIQNIDFDENDIVIVQWSTNYRFEIGVNDKFRYDKTENFGIYDNVDCLETESDYRVKTICRSLVSKTSDQNCKQYISDTFKNFYNEKWFDDMFKVMFNSVYHKLKNSGCKFILFDGWCKCCSDDLFLEFPEYVFRGTTVTHIVRGWEGNDQIPDKSHPNALENQFGAELFEKKIKELYYSHNEDESCYIPELRKKYQPK